jgi:hypothetical protein
MKRNMPQRKKQDYVNFIAAQAPRMSVASLKRLVRCIAEETKSAATKSAATKSAATKSAATKTNPAAPRVHFADDDGRR